MEDRICSVVRFHLKIFRFFCFCPISLSSNVKRAHIQKILFRIWNIILIVFFNVLTAAYFKFQDTLLHTDDSFGFAIDCIKLFTTSFTMQVFILEPLFRNRFNRIFWQQYIRLSATRSLASASLKTQIKAYKWFLLKFYCYFAVNQVTEALVFVSMQDHPAVVMLFWTFFIPYTYFLRFRTMHLMFCLDLITVELQCLNNELSLLVEYTEFGAHRKSFERFDEFIRLRIVQKQKMYGDIFEMVESFKTANGLSIIANYLKYYVRVLVSCYWCYWAWCNSSLSIQDILLVPAILEIPMFLLTAKSCMNAAKYISYRVHNLKHSADNIATSVQIQNFSLQLLHQKIKIDGLGIASMDGYMLTKAVGSITTYMVFFIQFMPKFKSKFD